MVTTDLRIRVAECQGNQHNTFWAGIEPQIRFRHDILNTLYIYLIGRPANDAFRLINCFFTTDNKRNYCIESSKKKKLYRLRLFSYDLYLNTTTVS